MPTFSGYLSVFNDQDILAKTLESVKGLISELVVVDGGYTWMQSYLETTGKNPERSSDALYDILDASGIKYRSINRLWKNEIEKRLAGYEACETDYIFRIDADEITFLSDDVFSRFLSSGGAVAEMDMPMYDSPGLVHCNPEASRFPRQGFLFDRRQISPSDHLHYLWLVLTADQLNKTGFSRKPVHPEAVAFNAHLSNWRTPLGGLQRASFYTLNYMRQHGVPAASGLPSGPVSDFKELFETIPPSIYESAMSRSGVINHQYALDGGGFRETPLSDADERFFSDLYHRFVESTQAHNEAARHSDQGFLIGSSLFFHRHESNLGKAGSIVLEFSCDIQSASGRLHSVSTVQPLTSAQSLEVTVSGRRVEIEIPALASSSEALVRQLLEISVAPQAPHWFGHFRMTASENL